MIGSAHHLTLANSCQSIMVRGKGDKERAQYHDLNCALNRLNYGLYRPSNENTSMGRGDMKQTQN